MCLSKIFATSIYDIKSKKLSYIRNHLDSVCAGSSRFDSKSYQIVKKLITEINKKHSMHSDAWIDAWKFFSRSYRKNPKTNEVELRFPFASFNVDTPILNNTVYKAECSPVFSDDNKIYVGGFHSFPTREEARKYNAYRKLNFGDVDLNLTLKKIQIKNILHIGQDGKDSIVYVSQYFIIPS